MRLEEAECVSDNPSYHSVALVERDVNPGGFIWAGYDSDFLDDTALITAFDNAINPIKAMLGEKPTQNLVGEKSGQKPSKKKHRKNRNKSKKEDAHFQARWCVGCPCRCKYSEDGLIYNAVIIAIDDEDLCTVRYDHYNNEEQQRLCDLLPPLDSQSHSSIVSSDVESVPEVSAFFTSTEPKEGFKFPHSAKQRSHKSYKFKKTAPNRSPHFSSTAFPFSTDIPPYPHMPSAYPQVPPSFARMPPSFCRIPRVPGVPLIPPPPPPMMSNIDSTDCDKEALYSMLISWYMSGYHTGYYEGLKKHSRRQSKYEDDSSADTASTETASSAK